jgi:GLPGLI family protein
MDSIKPYIAFFLLLFVLSTGIGQMKSGVIIFERKTNLLKKYDNEQSRKWLGDKKVKIDKFELHFTPTESFFVPVKVPDEGRMGWLTMKNTVHQDLENNERLSIFNMWGESIYVKDVLVKREWKVTERKRKIAGYECRRAIWVKNDSTKIYAWYTDAILPSCGPETFNGLPGTILGLATEDGGVVYFAKSVKEQYADINELLPNTKKKDVLTEDELKVQLEKRTKGNPWMKNVINEIFAW